MATVPLPITTRRRWRVLAFRLAAVLVGLLPLLACELAFRWLDWGRPNLHEDPFVGFSATRPLFVLDPTRTRFEIAPSRRLFFQPDSFAAVKSPREFRIFCLGGSTVQGRPFSIETSFTTWLELSLQAADPSRSWEVVNCGGVSYASYRLAPIVEELLQHKPDLFILCTGHNEFLEDRTYAAIKRTPAAVRLPLEWLSRLRTFVLAREAVLRLADQEPDPDAATRPVLPKEVDTILDYRGGLRSYHRDDRWREGVIAHFEFNLRRMIELAPVRGRAGDPGQPGL